MSVLVKCAEFDPNCPGCKASRQIMDNDIRIRALALKKIKELTSQLTANAAEIAALREVVEAARIKVGLSAGAKNDLDATDNLFEAFKRLDALSAKEGV